MDTVLVCLLVPLPHDLRTKDVLSLFFFGGMSIHLSTAILAHLCSYDMYAVHPAETPRY